jgi:serine phosphatase RsbU (regulator of sigma subunit)
MNKSPKSLVLFPAKILLFLFFAPLLSSMSGQFTGMLTPELIAQDSIRAYTLLKQAEALMEQDSLNPAYDLAMEALQSAMRSNQAETEILSLIADILDRRDQPGEAIPYYLRMADILENDGDTSGLPAVYTKIARNYHLEGFYEKEGEYYLNALHLTSSENIAFQADYLEKIGVSTLLAGMTDSSIIYFEQLATMLESSGMDNSIALNHLVQAHNSNGQYEKALAYNGVLFERSRNKLDYPRMSALKNNIGYNLTLISKYDSAAVSYQEAIDYGRQAGIPQGDLALLMTNAGICYQNMNDSKKAKPLFAMAIRALDESGDYAEKSRIENILALIYFYEQDLYNAGLVSRSSIESAIQAGDPRRLSEGYLTYSRILREGNDPIQALEYYEDYLNIRDSLDFEARLNEQEQERRRDQLEKSERDLIIQLREDQVRELDRRRLVLQLEREEQERELLRQEHDIGLLEQERLRDSLEIARQRYLADQQARERERLARENARAREQDSITQVQQQQEILYLEQEQELDRLELEKQKDARKALTLISILGILITIIIAISLVTSRKKNLLLGRQKDEIQGKNKDLEQKNEEIMSQRDEIEAQRDMLSEQKEEIEHSNKEILKSLEYARKIQSSTLPDLESLNSVISDHFLFFRPRDIVSGDFYWIATVENSTVLTVADCTGHGVPGAFMSVLGMSLLKEIVQKEYITHPAVILRKLRKEIISALGQKGVSGEQRDGMDLSLITIYHDTGKLEYAGAYNPLYLVRSKKQPKPGAEGITVIGPEEKDNGYILYEVQADKMPISYFVRMDKFISHVITLIKGDNIYLFSDGYPDQFGGPRGKKFKYKPFKQLLLRNAHLPMEKQYQILNKTFDEWKGIEPQVDDICVIGLKI